MYSRTPQGLKKVAFITSCLLVRRVCIATWKVLCQVSTSRKIKKMLAHQLNSIDWLLVFVPIGTAANDIQFQAFLLNLLLKMPQRQQKIRRLTTMSLKAFGFQLPSTCGSLGWAFLGVLRKI
jgi:hypothetical protein